MTKRSISGAAVVVWEDFMIDTIAKCLGACDTDCPRLQPKFSSHLLRLSRHMYVIKIAWILWYDTKIRHPQVQEQLGNHVTLFDELASWDYVKKVNLGCICNWWNWVLCESDLRWRGVCRATFFGKESSCKRSRCSLGIHATTSQSNKTKPNHCSRCQSIFFTCYST